MKSPSTFKYIEGPDIKEPIPITEECIILSDAIPCYENTNNYKQQKSFMLLEKCTSDPIWVYDMYLHVANTKNNIYIPNIQYVENFNNSKPIKNNRYYKFITLNSKPRLHRILCSAWLNKNFDLTEFFYTTKFNVEQEGITEHLIYIENPGPGLPFKEINPNLQNEDGNNIADFNIFKEYFYEHTIDSVFNLVNETSFWEDGCSFNEKTAYAFLSYNIPIVSGYGAAYSLERIGFDMFTDIVNYNSQWETNPFIRTYRLLDDNLSVLKDAHNILNKDILYRLEKNFNLINQTDINNIAISKLNEPKQVELLQDIMYNIQKAREGYFIEASNTAR